MNKIKQFSHSVVTHLWVFIMLQSGEQPGIQKNHYCDYILNHFTSALKRTCKIHRGVGYLQESFHAFAKAFLQTPRDALFSQTPCPTWYCLKFCPLYAKDYHFPIPTSHQRGIWACLQHCICSPYHFLKLSQKTYDMKYAQTLIKSKCTMSVTESVCQIAKHLHLCKCFEIHIRIWIEPNTYTDTAV